MNNNYDSIANYYDMLSRLVYFRAQVNAQTDQLGFIPENSKVLILGGGTGWILEELAKVYSSGLAITYVEISEKMLLLSKKRNIKDNHVTYVHSSAEGFNSKAVYDVILTAFFFDNFATLKAADLFAKFDAQLKPQGLWLFADFYYTEKSGKIWQAALLKIMYLFFRHISNVEASVLINVESEFERRNYLPVKTAYYYKGFIKSVVYSKSPICIPSV